MVFPCAILSDYNLSLRTEPLQQPQHRRLRHRYAARGRRKIRPRQMQKHRAAAACNARRKVVVDLDDEIIEMIGARQPVATLIAPQPHGLIIVAAGRILAPGILTPDRTNRQEGFGPRMPVGTPPQLPWPKNAPWGAAVAFPFVGLDAATAERDRYREPARHEPTSVRIAGRRTNPDRRQHEVARGGVGSH